jgi:competence protein ComFC
MWLVHATRHLLRHAGTLLYPPHCAVCGGDTPPRVHLCEACAQTAERIVSPRCERCSCPFDGAITGVFFCPNCGDRDVHYACAVPAYRSQAAVRELIHQFKYNHHFHLRRPLAAWLAETLVDSRILAQPIDALVPVPLHRVRHRDREFNQAEELAKLVGKPAGIPVAKLLQRIRNTTTQTRLSREERMENLRGAFRVRHNARVNGRHLVLVDDVFTTGSTVEECSRVLLHAGAATVRVITVARG